MQIRVQPQTSKLPARATETQRAVASMTPRSRAILPTALLDARVGQSTLAGSLNDQIRFRVRRNGSDDPTMWQLQPDTELTSALMQSKAGAALLRQLHTAMQSIGPYGASSNLKGFILPDDIESTIAARALSLLDDRADPLGRTLAGIGAAADTAAAGAFMQGWRSEMTARTARAGAWNIEGWVNFAPHTARAMLIAAGAYDPHGGREPRLLNAAARATYIAGNGVHEVQHSVSDRTPHATARWMEEGIANVFARTPVFLARSSRRSGVTPGSYAARLAEQPSFSTGWKPFVRPKRTPDAERDRKKQVPRMYGDSQVVLRDLVRLAGADFRSNAGQARAFELLQSKSIRYVPGLLADAIIERHQLDPSVRERLRTRIKHAVDIPGGVRAMAREFGIAGRPAPSQ